MNTRRHRRSVSLSSILLVLFLCMCFAGCKPSLEEPPATLPDYFPLAVGNSWEYRYPSGDTYETYSIVIDSSSVQPDGKTVYSLRYADSENNLRKYAMLPAQDGGKGRGASSDAGLVWLAGESSVTTDSTRTEEYSPPALLIDSRMTDQYGWRSTSELTRTIVERHPSIPGRMDTTISDGTYELWVTVQGTHLTSVPALEEPNPARMLKVYERKVIYTDPANPEVYSSTSFWWVVDGIGMVAERNLQFDTLNELVSYSVLVPPGWRLQ